MKKQLLLVMSAVFILASCNKTDSVVPADTKDNLESVAKNSQSSSRSVRPLEGSLTYHIADFNLNCACGSYNSAGNFYGTGNISHLGAASSKIQPCIAPLIVGGNMVGFHVGVECASFTSANGDEVFLHTNPYNLYFTPSGIVGTLNVDIIGGTGKFANATGNFTGIINTDGHSTATLTNINGTITY